MILLFPFKLNLRVPLIHFVFLIRGFFIFIETCTIGIKLHWNSRHNFFIVMRILGLLMIVLMSFFLLQKINWRKRIGNRPLLIHVFVWLNNRLTLNILSVYLWYLDVVVNIITFFLIWCSIRLDIKWLVFVKCIFSIHLFEISHFTLH
jgi:hypothetical protein